MFKRELKCELCQIRYKYTQIVKCKCEFQTLSAFESKCKCTQKSKRVFQMCHWYSVWIRDIANISPLNFYFFFCFIEYIYIYIYILDLECSQYRPSLPQFFFFIDYWVYIHYISWTMGAPSIFYFFYWVYIYILA